MMCENHSLLGAIRDTAVRLEAHLNIYNPAMNNERNGIPEANLTVHFAHQCLRRDWLVYPEASNVSHNTDSQNPIRVDLHVICEGQFILTVESKKFHSVEKAKEIISDYQRAQSLHYPHQYKDLPHYVLLLAITEDPNYENWWCNSENWYNNAPVWKELANILQNGDMAVSSFPMHTDEKTHHLLYAMSKVAE